MIHVARLARAAASAALAAGLCGCIAAALPLVAGGAITRSEAVSGKRPPAPEPANAPPAAAALLSGTGGIRLTELTELPPPTQADIEAGARHRIEELGIDAFHDYALSQAMTDPLEAPMRSALLADPASLRPIREDCGDRPPLVLIDLDPAGTIFDARADGEPSPALAQAVAELRAARIAIGWISAAPAALEAPIRARLAQSGLDRAGADRLLLVTQVAPTKQDLRMAAALAACPVAIAGDEQADFDELYTYLKTPGTAGTLEEMFGAGWFITPLPID